MRRMVPGGTLLLAAIVATPATASDLSVVQDHGQGSLGWHDAGKALVLRSAAVEGIHVIDAEPDGIFGLRKADAILAVDGRSVNSVKALLDRLHASKSKSATLLLLRQGKRQEVRVAVGDYQRFMPPAPPAPPVPPVPPAPPVPPVPPAASG